jgi:hypothetical protein
MGRSASWVFCFSESDKLKSVFAQVSGPYFVCFSNGRALIYTPYDLAESIANDMSVLDPLGAYLVVVLTNSAFLNLTLHLGGGLQRRFTYPSDDQGELRQVEQPHLDLPLEIRLENLSRECSFPEEILVRLFLALGYPRKALSNDFEYLAENLETLDDQVVFLPSFG